MSNHNLRSFKMILSCCILCLSFQIFLSNQFCHHRNCLYEPKIFWSWPKSILYPFYYLHDYNDFNTNAKSKTYGPGHSDMKPTLKCTVACGGLA